jgi:hypothetical protein
MNSLAMPIDTGLLVCEFEMNNAAMAVETSAVMARFIGEKALHARFLNTLSMLEHLGSHKIMATQRGKTIDQPTLKHLADETRHAFFFKRHADREAGRTMDYEHDDMVAASSARRYFHRLEAEIARVFDADAHPRAVYLTMSMIVEFRAVWGYRLYQAALESAGHTVSLKSLLAEERGHLTNMAERLHGLSELDHARVRELCAIEQRLYRKLLSAFAGSVATLPLSIDNAVTTVAGMVAG